MHDLALPLPLAVKVALTTIGLFILLWLFLEGVARFDL
jgi:hypothetical protein